MMRSLWTAASGMTGQQFNIDTISNNLANVNTTGFKQMRADFEDLIYQTERLAGTPATEATVVPTGVQVGHGVRPAATPVDCRAPWVKIFCVAAGRTPWPTCTPTGTTVTSVAGVPASRWVW